MILNFTETTRFYLYQGAVDMRKGIHSLYHLIQESKELDALSGDSFVFIGKNRKSIKILRWQKEGFVLYYKRLELGCYSLPHMVNDKLFKEMQSSIINDLIVAIKHRSNPNSLRSKALSTL